MHDHSSNLPQQLKILCASWAISFLPRRAFMLRGVLQIESDRAVAQELASYRQRCAELEVEVWDSG